MYALCKLEIQLLGMEQLELESEIAGRICTEYKLQVVQARIPHIAPILKELVLQGRIYSTCGCCELSLLILILPIETYFLTAV